MTSVTFLTSAVEADEARRRITRFRLAAGVAQLASADQAAGAVCPGRLRAVRAVRGLADVAGRREGAFARRHRAVARASGLRGRKPRLQKEQNEDESGSKERPSGSSFDPKFEIVFEIHFQLVFVQFLFLILKPRKHCHRYLTLIMSLTFLLERKKNADPSCDHDHDSLLGQKNFWFRFNKKLIFSRNR